jgi:hypothetical protein
VHQYGTHDAVCFRIVRVQLQRSPRPALAVIRRQLKRRYVLAFFEAAAMRRWY